MIAFQVKEALRGRHPALDRLGGPGPWTCIEEWMKIDLLAVCAWATAKPYPRYARVGYEVKVSRSDYKRELAAPAKRAAAVAFCHEFYFAVPHGLLKAAEIQWTPPWGFDSCRAPLDREPCPGAYGYACLRGRVRRVDRRYRNRWADGRDFRNDARVDAVCPTCWGSGWIAESPAVRAAAPGLWIPDDVGLAVVYPSGRVVNAKKAPRRQPWSANVKGGEPWSVGMSDAQLADLIRWVSYRPDPRHAEDRARRIPEQPLASTG